VMLLSKRSLPWSFYAVIVTFGIFFFSINAYFLTIWLAHPWRSDLWLLVVGIGLVGLLYSVYMVRIHQRDLIAAKEQLSE
jgi:MFS family permease